MWFRIGCMALYIWLMIVHVHYWMQSLMAQRYDMLLNPLNWFYIHYRVGFFWWAFSSLALLINAFFLFCGLFILPMVMGCW